LSFIGLICTKILNAGCIIMLLELINSIFVTFLATECLLLNNENRDEITSIANPNQRSSLHRLLHRYTSIFSRPFQILTLLVASINLFVHFHDRGVALSNWIKTHLGSFHIPRIVAAIFTFLGALWFDCRRIVNNTSVKKIANENKASASWSNTYFLWQLAKSFCKLLPVYPFVAVIISFMFLFIITAFEKLHLQTAILNGPIYYVTLYGPLMLTYWDVKGVFAKTIINAELIPR